MHNGLWCSVINAYHPKLRSKNVMLNSIQGPKDSSNQPARSDGTLGNDLNIIQAGGHYFRHTAMCIERAHPWLETQIAPAFKMIIKNATVGADSDSRK